MTGAGLPPAPDVSSAAELMAALDALADAPAPLIVVLDFDGTLAVGRPAKVVRNLTEEEIEGLRRSAAGYRANADRFTAGLQPAPVR